MTSILWTSYAWFFERFTRLLPYQELLDEVIAKIAPQPNQLILDAGCGPGALEFQLLKTCPTAKVWAVDFSRAMLAIAQKRTIWPRDWEFIYADLNQFLDETSLKFDRITCVNVLWTLPDPKTTLKQLASRLSPHGKLILAIPIKRFRADRIFCCHIAKQTGLKRLRAIMSLAWLIPGILLNVLLVLQSMLKGVNKRDRYRFYSEHFQDLYEPAGLFCEYEGLSYANQDRLLVFSRRPIGKNDVDV